MSRIVIGDIHGCVKTFKMLLEEKIRPAADDVVYCVGDLIDRGPASREVIDYILNLRREGLRIFSVRGNHEDMFLKTLDNMSFMQSWFANGAEETLRSFHIPDQMIHHYDCLKLVPEIYITFIKSLPFYYDLGDYVIVHAGVNFNTEKVFEDTDAMLWIRNMDYKTNKIGNKTIVHGHTPIPLSIIKSNIALVESKILNVDAGCVYNDLPGYGILASFDLDTRELFSMENID
jgi:serine/threonine protein phosphatase 1